MEHHKIGTITCYGTTMGWFPWLTPVRLDSQSPGAGTHNHHSWPQKWATWPINTTSECEPALYCVSQSCVCRLAKVWSGSGLAPSGLNLLHSALFIFPNYPLAFPLLFPHCFTFSFTKPLRLRSSPFWPPLSIITFAFNPFLPYDSTINPVARILGCTDVCTIWLIAL